MKIRLIRKQAMPVPPPTPEERRRMLDEGIGVAPFDSRHKSPKSSLPNTTKTQLATLVEQAGGPFWEQLSAEDKKTVLQLPQIHKLDPEFIVEINGQNYYIVNVVEPKDVKKVTVFDGVTYQKGERYPGKIIALGATDGMPTEFPYDGTAENIKQPAEKKERIMAAMNAEIEQWNKRIANIEKASGMSRLALQLKAAEDKVDSRLETLQGMIASITQKRDNPMSSEGYNSWIQRVLDSVTTGQATIKDAFDIILHKYQNNADRLISDIESGNINCPEALRQPLLNIARAEKANKQRNEEQEAQEEVAKTESMDSEWPSEEGVFDEPLPIVTEDSIPGGDYKQLPSYGSLDNIRSQPGQQLKSLNADLQGVTSVKSALTRLRGFIGDLESGQRGKEFLSSPEGEGIVTQVMTSLNDIKRFIKRYKTPPLDQGKVNPKLFGTKGDNLGNALLSVALNKIIATVYKTIEPFIRQPESPTEPTESMQPTTTEITEQPGQTVTSRKTHDLTKLSMDKNMWSDFLKRYLGN